MADDWFVFWSFAKHLGKQIHFDGVAIDMETAPTQKDLLAILARNASVPFDEIRRHPVRRVRDVQNTMSRQLEAVRKRMPHNPAWLHPDDLLALGAASGQVSAIESAHGRIEAVVEADDSMRPGVVSISHGWGGLPGDAPDPADPHGAGVNVNRLTTTRADRQTINAMPRLTAIPVRTTPLHTRAGFQVSESQHHQRTFPS